MRVLSLLNAWVPVFIWAGLIFYVSGIPSLGTDWGIWDLILRKLAHIFEFFVLTVLIFRGFDRSGSTAPGFKSMVIWGAVMALGYALSDEFHQSFVPGRGPSPVDVLIDGLGVALASLFYFKFRAARFFKSR